MIAVSIIIPIYNVGKYIDRCLNSIYNQSVDYDSFEVIAINDGSTDNSSEEVKKFQRNHCNIKLIEKENGGVSSARNVGISKAVGKYVIFVDPDDELLPYSMPKLIDFCLKNEDNVVFFRSFSEELGREVYKWSDKFGDNETVASNDVINRGYIRGSVCGGAYKLSFIKQHNLTFIEGMRNGEDTTFRAFAMHYASNVKFNDIKLYNVVGREGSASRSFNEARVKACIESLGKVDEKIMQIKSNCPVLQYLRYQLRSNLFWTAHHTQGMSYSRLLKLGLKKRHHISHKDIHFHRREIMLMNLSPRLFYFISGTKH